MEDKRKKEKEDHEKTLKKFFEEKDPAKKEELRKELREKYWDCIF